MTIPVSVASSVASLASSSASNNRSIILPPRQDDRVTFDHGTSTTNSCDLYVNYTAIFRRTIAVFVLIAFKNHVHVSRINIYEEVLTVCDRNLPKQRADSWTKVYTRVEGRLDEIVRIFTITAAALLVNKRPLSYDSRAVTGQQRRRRRRLKTVTHTFIRQRQCPVRVDCASRLVVIPHTSPPRHAATSSSTTASSSFKPMTHGAKTDAKKAPENYTICVWSEFDIVPFFGATQHSANGTRTWCQNGAGFRWPVCGPCGIDLRICSTAAERFWVVWRSVARVIDIPADRRQWRWQYSDAGLLRRHLDVSCRRHCRRDPTDRMSVTWFIIIIIMIVLIIIDPCVCVCKWEQTRFRVFMHRNAPSSPSRQHQQQQQPWRRPLMQTQAITLQAGITPLLYASPSADVFVISSVTVLCVVTGVDFKLLDAAVMNFTFNSTGRWPFHRHICCCTVT